MFGQSNRLRRLSIRVICAIGISLALSGCVIEPLYPRYHHPYYY